MKVKHLHLAPMTCEFVVYVSGPEHQTLGESSLPLDHLLSVILPDLNYQD